MQRLKRLIALICTLYTSLGNMMILPLYSFKTSSKPSHYAPVVSRIFYLNHID